MPALGGVEVGEFDADSDFDLADREQPPLASRTPQCAYRFHRLARAPLPFSAL